MANERRLAELIERVAAAPRPIAAALSASEWHELAEGFRSMVTIPDGSMSVIYRLCDAIEHRDALRRQVDRLTEENAALREQLAQAVSPSR